MLFLLRNLGSAIFAYGTEILFTHSIAEVVEKFQNKSKSKLYKSSTNWLHGRTGQPESGQLNIEDGCPMGNQVLFLSSN